MIKVTYVTNNGKFVSLLVEGHAQFAKKGEDLVCAGVSAIAIGGLNALTAPDDFEIEVNEAHVSVKATKAITNHDEIVLQSVLIQLETVADSYPKFVKINK
ncbi:MAG: ribosomal-processing cysteine protease Prp [Firmicutes bacterium]|nr:ribosomal-processing cysteine protease Prp [Bacillota bacterium]